MADSAIRRVYVSASSGQVHCLSGGHDSDPAVLFLHRSPASARMWEPVLPLFVERGWRVVAPDYPGFGRSDSPQSEPDLSYYADIMTEVVDRLGISRFSIVGMHTGAVIGAIMSSDAGRVAALAAIGYLMVDTAMRTQLLGMRMRPFELDGSTLDVIWNAVSARGRGLMSPAHARRHVIDELLAGDNWNWAYRAVANADTNAILSRIASRVMFLAGGAESGGVAAQQHAAAALVYGSAAYIFEGAGINLPDEVPLELTAVISSFLGS